MRVILHSDLNNFYASVECFLHPELAGKPVAVCGDSKARHGVVLAKNYIAKSFGIKTGHVIWEAKNLCPALVVVNANFDKYVEFSNKVRKIYEDFTDMVEPFGIDECWLDVTHSRLLFGDGKTIADTIRERIKKEVGITASVGVSYNKIFAKLGSELHKPDKTTEITENNYKDIVWKLAVEELLYVGKAIKSKLNKYNIWTIGELANTDVEFLTERLGKWGQYLHVFANGLDLSPVSRVQDEQVIKSIGNSLTNYKDLYTLEDVKMLIHVLCESVGARVRELGYAKAKTVHISVRDSALESYSKQGQLRLPSRLSCDFADRAIELFKEIFPWRNPVRGIGVSVSNFIVTQGEQLSCLKDDKAYYRREKLEEAVDKVRKKHGYTKLKKAIVMRDEVLSDADIKNEHTIHPESFFK